MMVKLPTTNNNQYISTRSKCTHLDGLYIGLFYDTGELFVRMTIKYTDSILVIAMLDNVCPKILKIGT